MIATIGYEKANLDHFLGSLQKAKVEIVVDIRDRAQSRRRGFSKSALSDALASVGIGYMHIKELGDPKPGRDAARSGDFKTFKKIYRAVLETPQAKESLNRLEKLGRTNNVCLLCYERDQSTCHRKIVSDILEVRLDSKAVHLGVQPIEPSFAERGRVFHSRQSAAA